MYKGSFVSCFQRYRPSKSWYSRVNRNLSSAHLNGSTNQPDLKNYFVNKNLSYLTFGFFWLFWWKYKLNWKVSTLPILEYFNRPFSHVTKSRIFKHLNLRRKAYCEFRANLLENHFRYPKLDSNLPSWLASRCHMATFWKTLVTGPLFQVLLLGSSPPKTT